MKPMLAVAAPQQLTFPLLASYKLDGVRCLIENGVAKTRKLEVIPNGYVQQMLGHTLLDGLDGELCVGPANDPRVFNTTQSGVMSLPGEPDFTFYVFDLWNMGETEGYAQRYAALKHTFKELEPYRSHPRIKVLEHRYINSLGELTAFQRDALALGYEGLILRSIDGPYKFGRSTAKQGWMMKLKQFSDGEATVLECVEMLHNDNELEQNNVGGAKRSKAQAGMRPAGCLGALRVKDCVSGVEFSIGTGFDQSERELYWNSRDKLIGLVVKYKHFEVGVKDAPRFPVFLGFRNPADMGAPDETTA